MDWRAFYAPVMWTLGFWAWGADYTIVFQRHIGLDIGTNRRAVNVPALHGGRVVIVTKTQSMGWVVVLDTGLPGSRRYHSYCHLSAEKLPDERDRIERGERVGRLAAGPKGVPYSSVEYPGTAWGGIHLHLVMSDVAHGSYTRNTGASFANPEVFIREALAGGSPAGGGSVPFVPEEDDVLNEDDKNWVTQTVRAEIGSALSAFSAAYKDQDWVREAVRQELGGAFSGFTGTIADAVVSRLGSKS